MSHGFIDLRRGPFLSPEDDPGGGTAPDGDEEPEANGGGSEETRYEPVDSGGERRRGISSWVERRATTVVSKLYRTQADDIEERARRAVSQAYQERADDLEERAVRAMRRALSEEADRFKEVIEHAVSVKKREVRLSLLVLLTAALIYFLLDWFSGGGA